MAVKVCGKCCGEWLRKPDPDVVVKTMLKAERNRQKDVNFFFPKNKLLIIDTSQEAFLEVCNLLPEQQDFVESLVKAEGSFLVDGENIL